MDKNLLYYGDNLEIMRHYLSDESVDLIYLDPPFNSNQDYNVLFREQDGARSSAQITAFEDTWRWDQAAAAAYSNVVEQGGQISRAMQAFRTAIGENDLLAYLSMMAPRLAEMKRILKDTGSIYLHCDPTASHYLKMLMDAIFGPQNFKNEIIWKRTSAHSDSKRYGSNIDIILFYTKSNTWVWNQLYSKHDPDYVKRFRHQDKNGRLWTDDNLTAKGLSGGGYEYEYKGVKSLWRCPEETMIKLDKESRLHFTSKGGIRIKRYLDETKGVGLQSLWTDIAPINSQAKERLGYPTQKPEALLERIISASSNEGDVVFDPFCGCGTTIAAAQKLNRRWIGIDVTHLSISLMKARINDMFGDDCEFEVIGEPKDIQGAQSLAAEDPYQFQWWALSLVGARPVEQKKGADKGIDGRLYFHDEGPRGKTKQIIISVKAGKTQVSHLRDLRGVLDRENAEIGVLVSMQEPTSPMRKEAATAGFYKSPWGQHPRLQLLTIEDLFNGKTIDYPPSQQTNVTHKKAPKAKRKETTQKEFEF